MGNWVDWKWNEMNKVGSTLYMYFMDIEVMSFVFMNGFENHESGENVSNGYVFFLAESSN